MQSKHYFRLREDSVAGKIFIIGDVHGTAELFDSVLQKLSDDDVLIVAGDLIDRGEKNCVPTSALVLDKIMAHNAQGKSKIYVIRGNHEEDFLTVMDMIKNLAQLRKQDERAPVPPEVSVMLTTFIGNGGGWIFKAESSQEKARQMKFRNYSACKDDAYARPALDEIYRMFRQGDPLDLLMPNCGAYEAYVCTLPYIIKVDSEDNPVLVAHADLPLSDEALSEKMLGGIDLTMHEIEHITGARVCDFSATRTEESVLVYCGHNIIDEEGSTRRDPALPVRKSTHHINLDGVSYFTEGQLLVNHTEHLVEVVGVIADPGSQALLDYAQKTIQEYIAPALSPGPGV